MISRYIVQVSKLFLSPFPFFCKRQWIAPFPHPKEPFKSLHEKPATMVSIKTLFLFATTTLEAAVPSAPSSKLIYSDLVALDNCVLSLKSSIQDYSGGLLSATPILGGITAVHLANRKAYTDALLIPNATPSDSQIIVDFVSETLAKHIPESVEILESKKELFEKDQLEGTVVGSLRLLKYDHDTLSAALVEKVDPAVLPQATVAVKVIDDALDMGIATFST
ncbi:hydrophobic surface binding protein A-domain-containing protein [Rhexocercosporidium sp. MPI-PUGE-AT-0058]|nr:hydrophobic surface binding protein A-domain-containing protein [Rhexocercosporidium sp. MPI-PUGE-AT-0058]